MTYLIIGLLIGYILTDKKKAILNYLGTPTNGKLQLDWTTRQVFRIVSRKASERFYEASRYLDINWFIAVACGLGFINIYQFSYSTKIEDVYNTAIKIYPFWKKLDDEKLIQISDSLLVDDSVCLENIFKAGGNVIYDWLNGFFRIYE